MRISPQEIASDRGSPLYRIEDLLLTSERKYESSKMDRDVDELNQDIGKICTLYITHTHIFFYAILYYTYILALSALRLLQRPSFTPNTDKNIVKFSRIKESTLPPALQRRPSCRFECIHIHRPLPINPTANKNGNKLSPTPESNPVPVESHVRVTCVLDIAHNPDAMTALMRKMDKYYPNRPFR